MLDIENLVRSGEPQQVGDVELIPQTNVLQIKLRGHNAGLVWNRPRAVLLRRPDGQETILPVKDITRTIIWGMLAGGILGAVLIGLMKREK
ncbi:MAG: hypothetical protein C3F13_08875 [Anaerolineales bacterium]|nr:hypothetical protein [Anaerolineae bacterium]PWB53518.1 MAG: hypothetical protein C3F13_08875 [Anaerolineales bacterium]